MAPAKPGAAAEASAGARAAIASAHPLATTAGHEILKRGGNAFDAAVAVAATLAVVEPYSSGLGGGGLWLLHRAADGHQVMVDARETAPAGVKPELYIDGSGKPVRGATTRGGTAAAIPGAPAALVHVASRYGALPLAETLAPAIRHARGGFPVDERYARLTALRERFLLQEAEASRIFLDNGRAPRAGWLLRQSELAATLERLAQEGNGGFYTGPIARALVESVNRAGGVWQPSDLAGYRVIERAPLRVEYRGAIVTTAALPSAGGIALAQCLQMLERFETIDARSPRDAHLVIEALRRAFRDRAAYLGDADFAAVPVERLTSRAYAAQRAATIDPGTATRSEAPEREPGAAGSGNTTHLSIVDAAGNRVAATLTINLLFGSGIVAGDTGVLINNEMDDFTVRADVPNSFRLRGGEANAIAPGKRPLSSMTPTFVEDAKGVLVLGTPGGSRIVSQVLLAILDYLHAPVVDLPRLVGAPRYHHQWWPDRVEVEPEGFPAEWRAALEAKGHRLEPARRKWGNMQAVFKSKQTGVAQAASDPRGAE
ncbi:MAG: gamma-glutamyltransferase [Betaproteobacteria bacterium]|nr:gamma-glutamyltransferase [Betaproteobacteria bacterium]